MSSYLLPIADREPLAWIIANQRTAVGRHRRRKAEALERGDRILLYTTRGCFRNPTRDRGRVIGIARVTSRARELDKSMRFAEREYPIEVRFRIESLAPRREGVELVTLRDRLEGFPSAKAWSAHLRRALVPLAHADAEKIACALAGVALPYRESARTYIG